MTNSLLIKLIPILSATFYWLYKEQKWFTVKKMFILFNYCVLTFSFNRVWYESLKKYLFPTLKQFNLNDRFYLLMVRLVWFLNFQYSLSSEIMLIRQSMRLRMKIKKQTNMFLFVDMIFYFFEIETNYDVLDTVLITFTIYCKSLVIKTSILMNRCVMVIQTCINRIHKIYSFDSIKNPFLPTQNKNLLMRSFCSQWFNLLINILPIVNEILVFSICKCIRDLISLNVFYDIGLFFKKVSGFFKINGSFWKLDEKQKFYAFYLLEISPLIVVKNLLVNSKLSLSLREILLMLIELKEKK